MKLEDIDRNFKLDTVKEEDVEWISALDERIALSGVYFDEEADCFLRLPFEVARATSEGVYNLANRTAGGRARFVTNSPYVAVRAVLYNTGLAAHMTPFLKYGFSLHDRDSYLGMLTATPDAIKPGEDVGFEGIRKFSPKNRHMTLFFPLYGGVRALFIGIRRGSYIKKEKPYKNEGKPVVFYGSSITQGGCACRPGTDYISMVCNDLNVDYINLGFSGNAKAEDAICEYIASLPMSVFVYDYDHNAPNAEYLEETHEKFFMRIRELRPDLPVLMISRPDHSGDIYKRLAVVRRTYENALARGDRNVYFIDGSTFFTKQLLQYATVDGCHPNTLGFYLMAKKVKPLLRSIMKSMK